MMRPLLGILMTLAAMGASAEESAAVKYRQHTMEAVGGHMQAAVAIVKGEVDHKSDLSVHAAGLAGLSGIAPGLFGADAKGGDALPAIWDDSKAFQERLDAFRTAAVDFDAAVTSGAMEKIGPALGALGKACKACHDDFKKD
jgi:cytochrome c556